MVRYDPPAAECHCACGASLVVPGQAADEGPPVLIMAIATKDDVRVRLRAPRYPEGEMWRKALAGAIDSNEERNKAPWARDFRRHCRPGVRWMADDEAVACLSCEKQFTRFNRRHHCRNCGKLFCDSCTAWDHTVPGCGEDRVRVCAACLEELTASP